MTDEPQEQAPPPMIIGGPTPHTDKHQRHIVYVPFDVATDLIGGAARAALSGIKGAGHIAAEAVRDVTGDQTALGGQPAEQEHPRNVLWIPFDVVKGGVIAGANVVHHAVGGVGTAAVDTAKDVAGTE